MPSPEVFAAFAVASLALLIVPGPSVLYIVTRSMDQGRAAGLVSVLGIHTGSIVHVAAAALGLSAILASSAVVVRDREVRGRGLPRLARDPSDPWPRRGGSGPALARSTR